MRLPSVSTHLLGEAPAAAAPAPVTPPLMTGMPANCPTLTMHPVQTPHAGRIDLWMTLAAVGVHTAALLVVSAAVALLVYEKLGLSLLRQT